MLAHVSLSPMSRFQTPLISLASKWRGDHIINRVEHDAVMADVLEGGAATPRYLFMATMSCGIAILGLLQSSAAVVIGAMLISPLMGPIMQLGFSLCVIDFRMMRRALIALVIGTLVALLMSYLIVKASPIREATSEILARTRPTLFDLMVAVFSGLAGAYAAITRKGETIVGVAIATALMPPLAVVGYGLAVGSMAIAGNAFFLFMTNLLAIALSVTLVAKWYGFGMQNSSQSTAWQAVLIAMTFLVLAVPLGIALRDIAASTWIGNGGRVETEAYLSRNGGAIDSFHVDHSGQVPIFNVVAFVPHYLPMAKNEIQKQIQAKLGREVQVELHQSLEANDSLQNGMADIDRIRGQVASIEARLSADAQRIILEQASTDAITQQLLANLVSVEVAEHEHIVVVRPHGPLMPEHKAVLALEAHLQGQMPGWTVVVRAQEESPITAAN